MPIKSLQIEELSVREGLPQIGKLHKGDVKQGNRPGRDLEHFRFVPDPEFASTLAVWRDLYGDQPDYFDPVYIVGETVEEAFNPWMEEWSATALLHRCDEETQVLSYNPQSAMYIKARIPCERLCNRACQCKPVGRLNLFLPEFMNATGIMGYVTAETHSVHDILEVQDALGGVVALRGRITGVPFIFGRAKETISAPFLKDGKRQRMNTTKSLFYLRPNAEYTRDHFLPGLKAATEAPMFGNPQPPPVPRLLDGSTPLERIQGDRSKPRRIGGGPVVTPDAGQPDIPTITPEVVEADEDEQEVVQWTADEAKLWAARLNQNDGISNDDILKALGVEKLGDFKGGVTQANKKLDAWLETKLAKSRKQETA